MAGGEDGAGRGGCFFFCLFFFSGVVGGAVRCGARVRKRCLCLAVKWWDQNRAELQGQAERGGGGGVGGGVGVGMNKEA